MDTKKIDMILSKESNRLLALNEQEVFFATIKYLIEDVNLFIQDILTGKINENELEENFLTKTIVFLWKLEKIYNMVISNKIRQIVIPVDFNIIDYTEFIYYYKFSEIQSNEWITAIIWNTTSIFNKLQKSDIFEWVYLLQQEIYDHEDDTDNSRYYIFFKWL